jgi:hypothetical protein
MGFSEKGALDLKPENTEGWAGVLKNWNGVLDPRLRAPAGVADWEAHSVALTFAEKAKGKAADGDGWDLLEACGLIQYTPGESPKLKSKSKAEHSPVNKPILPG